MQKTPHHPTEPMSASLPACGNVRRHNYSAMFLSGGDLQWLHLRRLSRYRFDSSTGNTIAGCSQFRPMNMPVSRAKHLPSDNSPTLNFNRCAAIQRHTANTPISQQLLTNTKSQQRLADNWFVNRVNFLHAPILHQMFSYVNIL